MPSLRVQFNNRLNAYRRFMRSLRRPSKAANIRRIHKREENVQSFIIRDVTEWDIPELAVLHVQTWNETYHRDSDSSAVTIREQQWNEQFKKAPADWFCLAIEKPGGELIGFAKGLRYAGTGALANYTGELNKIYLLRDYHRLGLGRRLMGCVARRFLQMEIHSMLLFGIAQNPSCKFHEVLGAKRLLDDAGQFNGGYGWMHLEELSDRCPPD